jgi:hypothetical protein
MGYQEAFPSLWRKRPSLSHRAVARFALLDHRLPNLIMVPLAGQLQRPGRALANSAYACTPVQCDSMILCTSYFRRASTVFCILAGDALSKWVPPMTA